MTDTTKKYCNMMHNQGVYATARHLHNTGFTLAYALYVLKQAKI